MRVLILASTLSSSVGSAVLRASAASLSNSGSLMKPQFEPLGGTCWLSTKRMKALCGSIVFQLELMAASCMPSGDLAPCRVRLIRAFQSMTWNSRSTPISANCCWMNSFMINGYICPEPAVEIATLILSRFCGP